jgi:Ca2+-binding EF-hand superfamily protein
VQAQRPPRNGDWNNVTKDRGDRRDPRDEKSARTTKSPILAKIAQRLPEQYRSVDRDLDGQIGLYEWSKTDYATFARLDLNGDGFLTPQELSRATAAKSAPTRTTASGTASVASTTTPAAGDSTTTPAADTSMPSGGPAEATFNVLDKDKDGRITEAEWKASLLPPIKFKAAGINPQFPMSRDEFFRDYPKAYGQ